MSKKPSVEERMKELETEFDAVRGELQAKADEYNAYAKETEQKLLQMQGAYKELEKLK